MNCPSNQRIRFDDQGARHAGILWIQDIVPARLGPFHWPITGTIMRHGAGSKSDGAKAARGSARRNKVSR